MADGSEQLATVKAYIAKYNLEVGSPRNRLTPVALSLCLSVWRRVLTRPRPLYALSLVRTG